MGGNEKLLRYGVTRRVLAAEPRHLDKEREEGGNRCVGGAGRVVTINIVVRDSVFTLN